VVPGWSPFLRDFLLVELGVSPLDGRPRFLFLRPFFELFVDLLISQKVKGRSIWVVAVDGAAKSTRVEKAVSD
jgi:hypothetical protein